MSNTVVLASELVKYEADDGLLFRQTSNNVTGPIINIEPASTFSLNTKFKCTGVPTGDGGIAGDATFRVGGVCIGFEGSKINLYSNDSSAESSETSTVDLVAGTVYDITATYSGGKYQLYINGALELDYTAPLFGKSVEAFTIGSGTQASKTEGILMELYSVTYTIDGVSVLDYSINGDFGSATVTDHSGNGRNGTMNGVIWWKKDVDQYFTTTQLFKDQLPATPVVVQNVIDVDTNAPATGDAYWGAYTPVWLTVTYQNAVSPDTNTTAYGGYRQRARWSALSHIGGYN